MTTGRNEFPIRLDEKAIKAILLKAEDSEIVAAALRALHSVMDATPETYRTVTLLIAFQEFLKERRVDPGFQVSLHE